MKINDKAEKNKYFDESAKLLNASMLASNLKLLFEDEIKTVHDK